MATALEAVPVTLLLAILKFLAGLISGKSPDPALAANAAVANERQAQTERENEALRKAADARAGADAVRLRLDPRAQEVHSEPTAPINLDPDLHLRD